MSIYQIVLFIFFAVISIIIVLDKNVAEYIDLLFKFMNLQFQRYLFIVKYHPKNPITNIIQYHKMNRIARQLQLEAQQKADS